MIQYTQSTTMVKSIYEKEREYRIGFFALFIMLIIFSTFIVLVTYYSSQGGNQGIPSRVTYANLDINYNGNFTIEEKNILGGIAHQVDPKYALFVKEINFTKNHKDIEEFCDSSSPDTVGCNFRDRILIYDDNYSKDWMRMAVCHEILHSLIIGGEKSHKIIYELGEEGICFKKNLGLNF